MRIFFYIVIISFLVRTIRNILYLTFLWQLKEYRLDRLLAHLKTSQGKKLILGSLTIFKLILFIGIIIGILPGLINGTFPNLAIAVFIGAISYFMFWLVWIFEALVNIREFILYRWRRPHFSIKVIIILLFLIAAIYILSHDDIISGIFFLGPYFDRLSGLLIALIVIIFNIPTFFYYKIIIGLAKKKISKTRRLIVIGITGSYGKTSTKEFLATILSEKYRVAKTPEFTNTDIGIAKYILKDFITFKDVVVVEMGAYKKGEIKAICDMVKPKIGIITGINEQHLELFGSIENTKRAKFELIESLPKGGYAIFNGKNNHCLEMAEWAKARDLKISTFNTAADVKNIHIFDNHIEFCLMDNNKYYQFKVNLLGKQSIENVLAAIYAAKCMGIKLEQIQIGVSKIVSPLKTMQFVGSMKGSTLIDDSFNANPSGVIAAINYMKRFKGKKIMVLMPLIELGRKAEKIHNFLGEQIATICDHIYLTNVNYHESFVAGAKKVGSENRVQIVNTLVGVKLVKDNMNKDGVVVFEGKEAGRILNQLTNNN